MQLEQGNYIYGYMVNLGFVDSVEVFYVLYFEIFMYFFWDKQDVDEVIKVDVILSFYQIDDVKFFNRMVGCRVYVSMVGFEFICEVMYLGKFVLMVFVYIEQDCNVYDVWQVGVGIIGEFFDLELLFCFVGMYVFNWEFICWVCSCE